ncbi:MAG: hypothetical protein LBN22_01660 [Clostridiales Family XIII bacterium]|jgi:competence protein ComGC|nr:hypothetical protein [Clostridiales Family XIII bacterium]
MMNSCKNKNGSTLIFVLVAMLILTLIIGIVLAITSRNLHRTNLSESQTQAHYTAETLNARIVQLISGASYESEPGESESESMALFSTSAAEDDASTGLDGEKFIKWLNESEETDATGNKIRIIRFPNGDASGGDVSGDALSYPDSKLGTATTTITLIAGASDQDYEIKISTTATYGGFGGLAQGKQTITQTLSSAGSKMVSIADAPVALSSGKSPKVVIQKFSTNFDYEDAMFQEIQADMNHLPEWAADAAQATAADVNATRNDEYELQDDELQGAAAVEEPAQETITQTGTLFTVAESEASAETDASAESSESVPSTKSTDESLTAQNPKITYFTLDNSETNQGANDFNILPIASDELNIYLTDTSNKRLSLFAGTSISEGAIFTKRDTTIGASPESTNEILAFAQNYWIFADPGANQAERHSKITSTTLNSGSILVQNNHELTIGANAVINADANKGIVVESGGSLIIEENAQITGDINVASGTVIIKDAAKMTGNIYSSGATVEIANRAEITGNLFIEKSIFNVKSGTSITGDVSAGNGAQLDITSGTVHGHLYVKKFTETEKKVDVTLADAKDAQLIINTGIFNTEQIVGDVTIAEGAKVIMQKGQIDGNLTVAKGNTELYMSGGRISGNVIVDEGSILGIAESNNALTKPTVDGDISVLTKSALSIKGGTKNNAQPTITGNIYIPKTATLNITGGAKNVSSYNPMITGNVYVSGKVTIDGNFTLDEISAQTSAGKANAKFGYVGEKSGLYVFENKGLVIQKSSGVPPIIVGNVDGIQTYGRVHTFYAYTTPGLSKVQSDKIFCQERNYSKKTHGTNICEHWLNKKWTPVSGSITND